MKFRNRTTWLPLCLAALSASPVGAEVQVAEVIHGHVVLQRGKPVPIWGIAVGILTIGIIIPFTTEYWCVQGSGTQ